MIFTTPYESERLPVYCFPSMSTRFYFRQTMIAGLAHRHGPHERSSSHYVLIEMLPNLAAGFVLSMS